MSSVTDSIIDKVFLENIFSYLETYYGIHTVLVDGNGQNVLPDVREIHDCPETRFYPLSSQGLISGFLCSAESAEMLQKAAPHIKLCMDSLQMMVDKEHILQQTVDEMLRLSDQLHFLLDLTNKLKGVQDVQQYCALVLQEISDSISADAAILHIKGKKDSQRAVVYGISGEDVEVIEKDPSLQSLPEDKTVIVTTRNEMSVLVAPVIEKDEKIGHVIFLKYPGRRVFSAYDKQFVSIVDSIISPTIERLALYQNLHILYINTVKALAAAIDAKDTYTHGHSYRVAKFSLAIGKQLELSASELSDLEIAAYMHDLGKIGIPEEILKKRGKLSEQEFEEIKKHPLLTNKILEPINLPESVVSATLQHHERLDGRGYPFGLVGNNITLFARIIAVVDVFDALTSARPYRDAMTVEAALTTLCEGIDTEFDRNIVCAFIKALRNNKTDEDLADVYSELKFLRLEEMNEFLENLTQHLISIPA